MAEAEQTFVENNEQQNLSLPDSDQHTLTVEDFDQQNITGDLQNDYELPEHDAEDQSLAGHEDNLTENDPENNFEMITEQDYVENENAQTLVEEQQDQGLDGNEVKLEFPENENDGATDDKQVDNKEEHENSSVGKVEEKKWPGWPGLSVFRMLVPSQKVGNIMGRKGEYIKKIVEETRARVKILDGPRGSQERAVMVSAKEEPDDPLPPAIDGLLGVHSRIVDGLDADASQAPPAGAKVSTKFLVPATQAGTLIGKQGATVKSIQEASSCIVRVLGQDALPTFALEDDRVVEVVGEPVNVHKAVELIAAELRKFLVDRSVIPIFEQLMQARSAPMDHMPPQPGPWGPPQGLPPHGGPHGYGPGPQYMQPPPRQHNNYYAPADMPPPLDTQHHQGITAYGREPAHAPSVAQSTPAMTTQIPQHMQVPLQYADAVIGANGSTISYVRRASGATVTIQETRGVPGEMTVEINGTPTQVQTAQQLIQNLMADAAAASAGTTQTGVAADQNYSQGYSAYAAPPATSAAPPAAYGSVYGSPASSAAPPAAYGSVYGGNYGY